MSTFKLPNSNKQFIQSNQGDYQGNVWSTFNIDPHTNPGAIMTSKKLQQVLGASLLGSDVVQALSIYDSKYFLTTNDRVFTCSTNNDPTDVGNWSAISTLGLEDLGLETDNVTFNGLSLFSLGTNIMSWDGNAKDVDYWTNVLGGPALTADKTHTLAVLRTGQDTLFVTNGNLVHYANTTAFSTTITLDTYLNAHVLLPALDKMWVGTYTENEENAYVYEIQVGNTNATQAYEVEGRAVLTGWVYKNVPFIVTDRGYVQAFNGAGFETVARFPWADKSKAMSGSRPGLVQDSATSRAIHPKGAGLSGKHAYIYVNTADEYVASTNLSPRGHSGVWVLDHDSFSLTHRYALALGSTDYGWSKVTRSGPVLITNTPQTRIMVGGEVNTDEEGVWMETDNTPQGYIVTVRHESDSVLDTFNSLYTKVDTLPSGSSVTVKYRTTWNEPVLVDDITWLNATQFTTTSSDVTDALIGQEIEIIAGYRSGYLANITAVEGGTTKTVTIDQSIGLLNETSDIQIDNWLTLGTHSPEEGEVKELGAKVPGTFVQYKVILTGNVTLREVLSSSENKNSVK